MLQKVIDNKASYISEIKTNQPLTSPRTWSKFKKIIQGMNYGDSFDLITPELILKSDQVDSWARNKICGIRKAAKSAGVIITSRCIDKENFIFRIWKGSPDQIRKSQMQRLDRTHTEEMEEYFFTV